MFAMAPIVSIESGSGLSAADVLQGGSVHISEVVHIALQSEDDASMPSILGLRGDDAQQVLDYVQTKLEATTPYRAQKHEGDISTYRSRLRALMMRLALSSGKLPQTLFLHGVQRDSIDSVAQGSFADIYKGRLGDTVVAIKRLRKFYIVKDTRSALCRESLLWRNLEHRHVLPFLGIAFDIFPSDFCMILPWISKGSIRSLMEDLREKGYPLDALHRQADRWYEQIAMGLAYLHSEEIVHGDLRGANVLVDDNWDAKLADFGLSVLAEAGSTSASLRGGASAWLAPELARPESFGLTSTRSTYASDIYSLACVGLELYTGRSPFYGMPELQIILRTLQGERPKRPLFFETEAMNDQLWSLITKCWAHSPSDRPTAQEIVRFFTEQSLSSVPQQRLQRQKTADQCLLSECVRPRRLSGTGYYCSSAHEAIGLSRNGCVRCRRHMVASDDLCNICRHETKEVAPCLIQVPHDHDLFVKASDRFQTTWGRTGRAPPVVRYVYKVVQQHAVVEKYEAYRASVELRGQYTRLGKLAGNEILGWHGTRRACMLGNDGCTQFCSSNSCALCGIISTSFDVAYGASGLGFGLGWEILGKGIYTSSSSSKSDRYSYNVLWNTPLKAMLLNKVVMGRCFVVDRADSMLAGLPAGYDSSRIPQAATVDDIAVYRNDAILPSFLIVYDGDWLT